MVDETAIDELKREKLSLLEEKEKREKGLPFLYGWKFYKWAREFFESKNKLNFICSANQIGKSSTQIRKCIHWATSPNMWWMLWPKMMNTSPTWKPIFWYFYPSVKTLEQEVKTKWIAEQLPRGEYKDHPTYGWKLVIKNKEYHAIEFNSGCILYFKTYNQDIEDLQAGTVAAAWLDEECEVPMYNEIIARLFCTDGFLHMVFTATKGQRFWRDVIEGRGANEKLPSAFKRQLTMFDCQKYEDGTPSIWDTNKIRAIIDKCKSKAEILRRVYGKFVKDDSIKYPGFDIERNYVPYPIMLDGKEFTGVPRGWLIYSGLDWGSGLDPEVRQKNHKTAYSFVSVSPDFKKLRLFKCRRIDDMQTTAGDALREYINDRGKLQCVIQSYDWACKDFGIIAERSNEQFVPAQKNHEIGEEQLNTLFKTGMLKIYRSDEADKLVDELLTCTNVTPKNQQEDDLIDSLRYAITQIPIDYDSIKREEIEAQENAIKKSSNDRQPEGRPTNDRTSTKDDFKEGELSIEDELSAWSELY